MLGDRSIAESRGASNAIENLDDVRVDLFHRYQA